MIVHNFLDFLEKEEKGNKCILRIRFIYTQFPLKFLFKEFWKNFKLQKKKQVYTYFFYDYLKNSWKFSLDWNKFWKRRIIDYLKLLKFTKIPLEISKDIWIFLFLKILIKNSSQKKRSLLKKIISQNFAWTQFCQNPFKTKSFNSDDHSISGYQIWEETSEQELGPWSMRVDQTR